MDYLSTVRVLDTDYKLRDDEAARINHTHKIAEIEDIPDTGALVPSGGSAGQVLAKASGTDYDTVWMDASSSGIAAAYPIGSLYVNNDSSKDPATTLGFGTWERQGEGRLMLSRGKVAGTATLFRDDAGARSGITLVDDVSNYDAVAIYAAKVDGSDYNFAWSSAPVLNVLGKTQARGSWSMYYMANSSVVQQCQFSWAATGTSFAWGSWSFINIRNSANGGIGGAGAETADKYRVYRILGINHDNIAAYETVTAWIRTA